MKYTEFEPSAKLKDVVQNYWCFEINEEDGIQYPIQHETLPNSSPSIVLIQQPYFNGVRILGPHTKKFKQSVFQNSKYFGIRIFPWITFKPNLYTLSEIVDKTDSAPPLLEENFKEFVLKNWVIDRKYLEEIEHKIISILETMEIVENNLIKHICYSLDQGESVQTIVEDLPVSIRVIQKKFKETVGLSMKQYASNSRQMKAWSALLYKKEEKMEVILSQNFYDQAHFINDFKKKMDRNPSDFETYMDRINIILHED